MTELLRFVAETDVTSRRRMRIIDTRMLWFPRALRHNNRVRIKTSREGGEGPEEKDR